jgi:hypothetical protein
MSQLKRRVRSVLLFLVFGLCLTAGVFGFDLGIGVKAGVTFPWYSGYGYEDWLAYWAFDRVIKLGFSGGAFITIGIFDFLAIQPEVFFSQLGGRSGYGTLSLNDKWNGIDIQALLKARFPTRRRAIFDLFAGPNLQIKTGTVDFEIKDYYGNVLLYGWWDDAVLRDPVLGLVFGLGMEFPMGSYFFTVDARYSLGLWSRFTGSGGFGPWYQNYVQVMVGAGFVLVGKHRTVSRMR